MKQIALFFSLFMFINILGADNTRPLRLGIALSGGGAKGVAQIPVLEELEKRKIPIHCITGTSIGSIVGGLYAMGYTPLQIKDIFFSTDWMKVLTDDITRNHRAMYMKPITDRTSLRLFFDKDGIRLPSGLVKGYNIEKLLARYTMMVPEKISFDSLFHPFAAVATVLTTGDKKVFRSGNLADAIRASMAIPSVFTPANVNDTLYLDGGLVDNNPVQEAYDLGADIVLAVNISAPLKSKEELDNFAAILDQSISFAMNKSSREALKQATFVIEPTVKSFGTLEFNKAEQIYDSGVVAVQRSFWIFDSLEKMTEPSSFKPNPGIQLPDTFHIASFEIEGSPITSPDVISQLRMDTGEPIRWQHLSSFLDRLVGSGFYRNVRIRLMPQGKNRFRLKASLESNTNNMLAIANHYDTYRNMEWLFSFVIFARKNYPFSHFIDVKLGSFPAFNVGSLVFIPGLPATGIGLVGSYQKKDINLYQNKQILARYKDERWSAKVMALHFIKNTALIELNGGFERLIGVPVIGLGDIPEFTRNRVFSSAVIKIDQLDDRYFPTVGYLLEAHLRYNWDNLWQGYWDRATFSWELFWNIKKKHIFHHTLHVGTTFNTPLNQPVYFDLGGYGSFRGYKTSEYIVRHFVMDEIGYRISLNNLIFIDTYLQGIAPMLNKWNWDTAVRKSNTSVNLALMVKLPITQAALTFTHSDHRKFLVWFEFGYNLDFPF